MSKLLGHFSRGGGGVKPPSEKVHTKAAFLWLSLPDNQTRRYVKKKLQFPQTAANGRLFPANAMYWPFGSLAWASCESGAVGNSLNIS